MVELGLDDSVESWRSIEEVAALAFERSPVVMANEAHSGFCRCVRTRVVGTRMIRVAHRAGCRLLAMEALPNFDGPPLLRTSLPERLGYLAQPEMVDLVDTALGLGWQLVGYEQTEEQGSRWGTGGRIPIEEVNRREQAQAENLVAIVERMSGPLLVWCGNDHHAKTLGSGWRPMGTEFRSLSGIEAFAVNQSAGVRFAPGTQADIELDGAQRELLDDRFGGTAAFLIDDVPRGIVSNLAGFDAYVVSTDNEMSGSLTEPPPNLNDQR